MTQFRPWLKTASEMLLKLTVNIFVSFRRELTRFTLRVIYSELFWITFGYDFKSNSSLNGNFIETRLIYEWLKIY